MSLSSAKQLLAFQKVGPDSELSCKLWIYYRHQYYFAFLVSLYLSCFYVGECVHTLSEPNPDGAGL